MGDHRIKMVLVELLSHKREEFISLAFVLNFASTCDSAREPSGLSGDTRPRRVSLKTREG